MSTPLCLKPLNTRLLNEVARPARGAGAPQMEGRNTNLFLLISKDRLLGQGLQEAADEAGLLLVHSPPDCLLRSRAAKCAGFP